MKGTSIFSTVTEISVDHLKNAYPKPHVGFGAILGTVSIYLL